MAKIIGNTVGIPNPQPDWEQNNPLKADYIKNKPPTHTHDNKDALDGITQDKIDDWDSKSGGIVLPKNLKLLKDITLTEDVKTLDVTFDKPVNEIAILFRVSFEATENKPLAVRTDGGMWYMFYSPALTMSQTRKVFFAHAKEVGDRYWECLISGAFMSTLQGISDSGSTPKLVISMRSDYISRYVKKINVFVPSVSENQMFKADSQILIWGNEVDEEV